MQKEKTQKKKTNVYDIASKSYDELLETYYEDYHYDLSVAERKTMDHKYRPKKLPLKVYNYKPWLENEESTIKEESSDEEESVDLSDMSPLEGYEEKVKEGKRLKILTPNKLLTRLPILLARIKAGNNSYKLTNEISQILYLLYQHNKITKRVSNNLIKLL